MVFSQNTFENRVHGLNVEDSVHFFWSVKHYKWILINFCFNTWSPFRLSRVMNFKVFVVLKCFLCGLGKRGARRIGLGFSAGGASAL